MKGVCMDKLLRLINTCYNYTFGTIWCVNEELWKERIEGYDQTSTRKFHFGLSIRRTPLYSLEMIPMLHGRSQSSRSTVAVKGCSPAKEDDYRTYFGDRVAPVSPLDFKRTPEKHNPEELESNDPVAWVTQMMLKPNSYKLRVTSAEEKDLEQFIEQRSRWND